MFSIYPNKSPDNQYLQLDIHVIAMYNYRMNEDQELKKGSTPILILSVLSNGPNHGYAIAREIQRLSVDALKVG